MFILGFVLGLLVSPFLLLSALALWTEPKEPPTKEEWKVM